MSSDRRSTTAPDHESPPTVTDIPDHAAGEATAVGGAPPAGEPLTTVVGIRELARNVSGVIAEIVRTGRPAIVTKHGAPCAAIMPIVRRTDPTLAPAPEIPDDMAAGAAGPGRMGSDSEVLAELARLAEALGPPAPPGWSPPPADVLPTSLP